jgi:hypothetical protein
MTNFNFIIATVAVGEKYIRRTMKLIADVTKVINVDFVVLTDQPTLFNSFENVTTINYDRPIFSYHDKRLVLKKGFENYDYVLLMDADHEVREPNFLTELNNLDLENNIYPQVLWKHPADCSFENFIEGNTFRAPYGLEYKDFCETNNLNIDGVILIQESFIIFKKNDEIEKFFSIWEMLAEFCEQKDMERNQGILGYGEGYSISVAAKNSNLIINEDSIIHHFAKSFKHLAWER